MREIGFPINKEIPSTEKFQSYELPSYQAVRTLYVGDYDDLTDSYKELIEAIEQENGIFTFRSYRVLFDRCFCSVGRPGNDDRA